MRVRVDSNPMANPNVRGEPAPLGPRRRQVGVEEGEQLRARDRADLAVKVRKV